MRNLTVTFFLCGLIAAAGMTEPASATPKPATDVAISKAVSSQVAELAMPVAGRNSLTALYPTPSDPAFLLIKAADAQGVAAQPGSGMAPKGDLVAYSQSCTKTGFCCFWFFENHTPYCF
jgi:hypothetical protein